MAERLSHTVATDRATSVAVPSSIEQVAWERSRCASGGLVSLVVETTGVGDDAELLIELEDLHGRRFGQFEDRVYGHRFVAAIRVPPAARGVLRATVELPAHRLRRVSPLLTVMAPVVVANARWNKPGACPGEVVTLSADVEGAANGTVAEVAVFAHGPGGAHDPVTHFRTPVLHSAVDAEWECRWPPADDAAPDGYVFRVSVDGIAADSGILDRIEPAEPDRSEGGRWP